MWGRVSGTAGILDSRPIRAPSSWRPSPRPRTTERSRGSWPSTIRGGWCWRSSEQPGAPRLWSPRAVGRGLCGHGVARAGAGSAPGARVPCPPPDRAAGHPCHGLGPRAARCPRAAARAHGATVPGPGRRGTGGSDGRRGGAGGQARAARGSRAHRRRTHDGNAGTRSRSRRSPGTQERSTMPVVSIREGPRGR